MLPQNRVEFIPLATEPELALNYTATSTVLANPADPLDVAPLYYQDQHTTLVLAYDGILFYSLRYSARRFLVTKKLFPLLSSLNALLWLVFRICRIITSFIWPLTDEWDGST
jgi:hypothetical protein